MHACVVRVTRYWGGYGYTVTVVFFKTMREGVIYVSIIVALKITVLPFHCVAFPLCSSLRFVVEVICT